MSQQRVCDLDGTIIDTLTDEWYTVQAGRAGETKDICYLCARSATAAAWVPWTATTDLVVGDRIRPTDTSINRAYDVITAGTTDATEPATWSETVGDLIIDGTVTYMVNLRPKWNARVYLDMPGMPSSISLSLWGWMSGSQEDAG
jgi:hypothetical protein